MWRGRNKWREHQTLELKSKSKYIAAKVVMATGRATQTGRQRMRDCDVHRRRVCCRPSIDENVSRALTSEWAGPAGPGFAESPDPGRPGRAAFLVVFTWESEEKIPFFL